MIFTILILEVTSLQHVYGQDFLLSINGEPITEAEFVFHMKSQKAVISGYFSSIFGARQGPDFWITSYAGSTPLDAIRDSTLQRLIDIKIHLMLARELGIIEDISFEAFQKSLETENRIRKEASREGKVIYGPEEFSENTYFAYWYSNLMIETMKAWKASKQASFKLYADSLIAGACVYSIPKNINEILLQYLK